MPPVPPHARVPLEIVEEELNKFDVYLLETFPDGMTRWGNDSNVNPFSGFSAIVDSSAGQMFLSDIQALLNRVDRGGHYLKVEECILARLEEIELQELISKQDQDDPEKR